MVNKTTSSTTTTTKTLLEQPLGGKSVYRYDNVTTRKISRGETAGGLLTTIGQIQMIGISIFVLSIGTAASLFTLEDLELTTPNYNLTNEFVAIDDPLNTIDYIQYGEGVVDSLIGFVEFLEPFGEFAQAGYTFILSIANTDLTSDAQPETSFLNTFGSNRVLTLAQTKFLTLESYYDELSPSEREWILDNVDETHYGALEQGFYQSRWYLFYFIDSVPYFFYTEQSVYDYVVELGFGT
jgi:hypothetical protein